MIECTKGLWEAYQRAGGSGAWEVAARIDLEGDEHAITLVATVPAGSGVSAEAAAANARACSAAPDFIAACEGEDPDVSAVAWLSALLHQLRETNWPAAQDDPGASWTALIHAEELADRLGAAVTKARGAVR